MTIFLLAVPRHADAAESTENSVSRVVELFSSFSGPRYSEKALIRKPMSSTGAILVEWCTPEASNAVRISGAWAVSSEPNISLRIIRSIDSSLGHLRLKYPVRGNYATISGRYESDRLFAWASVPGIEGIHYSQTDTATYISNRPLVIAAALVNRNLLEVELSEEYLADYLSFGFSLTGATPFVGIETVPADRALSLYQGEVAIVPAPSQPPIELTPAKNERFTGTEELIEALRNATTRKLSALGNRGLQLRLSGGKDSRLLLALLLDAGFSNITAVTQGDSTSEEVMVAAELANLAGIEHRVKLASLNKTTSIHDSVLQSIKDSQGMLLSEALGMPYAFADPFEIGEGYAAGQWPTFKAPYVRKAKHSLADLDQEWHAHIADNLSKEMYERASRVIRRWVGTAPSVSNNELLYLYGRNVRATNYMQASTIAIDNYSMVVFPFVDTEVTAVADALPERAKLSEIPLFLAIRELWPEALSIPLARGGKFRFERKGPLKSISGSDYELRTSKPLPREVSVLNPDYLDEAVDKQLLTSPLLEGARFVLDSPSWSSLRDHVSSDFVRLLKLMAGAKSEDDILRSMVQTRKHRILTQVWIWRLISADAWISKRWLG